LALLPGGSEWIILIVVVVVLIFGAGKIPQLAKSIGRARGEFEKGKFEGEEEVRKAREDSKKTEGTEREKLENAAKALGLNVEGKSDEELREELKKAI